MVVWFVRALDLLGNMVAGLEKAARFQAVAVPGHPQGPVSIARSSPPWLFLFFRGPVYGNFSISDPVREYALKEGWDSI